MDLTFDPSQGERFKGGTQRIKNLSEHWLSREVYCPSCGAESLRPYANNKPVADCYCDKCQADFELKSHRQMFGASVVDGAYATMIERLNSSRNPHLFLLHYSAALHAVVNLMVVPKYFFVPDMIMKRPPLAATARRAGWVGCRIMLSTIPQAGKIYLIQNGVARTQADVRGDWQRTVFLHDQKSNAAKGWLLNVMRCVERIGRPEFTLDDVHKFADEMSVLYPSNNHIRQKMRQQLQVLRDRGFLHFVGHGRYRLA